MEATSLHDNLRFKCAFSEAAVNHNSTVVTVGFVVLAIFVAFVGIQSGGWVPGIVLASLVVIFMLYSRRYMGRLTRESYLEITPDGELRCVYTGRATVTYPIREITSVAPSSLEEARKKYAGVPVVFNSRGEELYPPEGVLITFSRKWIKSIFPVYFNPADVQSFIAAINHARDALQQ